MAANVPFVIFIEDVGAEKIFNNYIGWNLDIFVIFTGRF
jgi:hypothetical protein